MSRQHHSYTIQEDQEEINVTNYKGPLAAASHYYLTQDHTTTWKKELAKQLFLLFVCLSGAYLYFDPAKSYAERVNQADWAWLYIVSTCVPALATLYVATDIFFRMHSMSRIPTELKHYLKNPKTLRERIGENFVIVFFSALSAVVLSTIIFLFSPKNRALWVVTALAALVFMDNTILHFLPIKLILTQKIWRAPFLPFEYLIKWLWRQYRDRSLTQEDLEQRIWDGVVAANHLEIKHLIMPRLEMAKEKCVRESLQWKWRHFGWRVKLHPALDNLSISETPLLDILAHAENPGLYFKIPNKINGLLSLLFSTLGGAWIWACASGFYAAPFNQFHTWINNAVVAGVTTSPSIYTMMVLLAFFGVMFVGQAYQYLTTWGHNITKIPAPIKLWPKIFLICMGLNGIMAGFSYAAGAELIHSQITYDWAKAFIPFLLACAYSGLSYAGFMSVRQFVNLMFTKVGQYLGSRETRDLMKTIEKIDQLNASILNMNGDQLEKELTGLTIENQKTLLGVDDKKYEEIIDHDNKYEEQKMKWVNRASSPGFFARLCGCGKTEERESLKNQTDYSEYGLQAPNY